MELWIYLGFWLLGIYTNYSSMLSIYLLGAFILSIPIFPWEVKGTRVIGISLCIFILGYGVGYFRLPLEYRSIDSPTDIEGRIISKSETKSDRLKYKIKIYKPKSLKGKKYITYLEEDILPGTVILNRTTLHPPEESPHPYGFQERTYYLGEDISFQGKSFEVSVLETSPRYRKWSEIIYKRLQNSLEYFPEEEKSLFSSMLLGNRYALDSQKIENLYQFGLGHILAISGLHLGILTGVFYGIISFITKNKRWSEHFSLGISFLYLFLVGFPISGMRVWLILFLSMILKRNRLPWKILYIPGFIMFLQTLWYPGVIFSFSFWLSYGAYFAILLMPKYLESIFYPYHQLAKVVIVTIGVHIFILPLLLTMESRIGILQLLGNIVLLPFYTLFITCGFLHMIIAFCLGTGVRIFIFGIHSLYRIIIYLESILSPFGKISITFPKPHLSFIFLYFFLLFFILRREKEEFTPKMRYSIMAYVLVFASIWSHQIWKDYLTPKVDFIYVGQGDSTLIRTKGLDLLFDTGGSHMEGYRPGKKYTLPYLQGKGIQSLDGVFLSHFDADHVDGLFDIMEKIEVKKVFVSHIPKEHPLIQYLSQNNIPIKKLKKGDRIEIPFGEINVISTGLEHTNEENDRSLVLDLVLKDFHLLFPGDAEEPLEKELVIPHSIDIYHVSHHGSKTSSTPSFLNQLSAKVGVISCGKNNEYGHPHKEVLERLHNAGISILRTDIMGSFYGKIDEEINFYDYRPKRYHNKDLLILAISYILFLWTMKKSMEDEDDLGRTVKKE
ncbi:MAG: DNA internalization-related competence protein ComEC/Rec2 [Tissierellia bacterium]|nr:DNA internalization-related competence protein ComEC/Rec2 [Tissierellia bacterium]